MVSSIKCSFLNFLLWSILFQRNILNSMAETQCLNPTFGPKQTIVVEYYCAFNDATNDAGHLCEIINHSNGLISRVYRIGADVTGKGSKGEPVCSTGACATGNRTFACFYKYHEAQFNDCNTSLPPESQQIITCARNGEADDILYKNGEASKKLGITRFPTLVVDGKYDPCFTDYSLEGQKTYFCTAYNNALPVCNQ